MSVNPKHVKLLIKRLADDTDCSLDHSGFGRMSERVPDGPVGSDVRGVEITQRYLYETYKKVERAIEEKKQSCRLYEGHLKVIALAIGYRNFHEFVQATERAFDPVIKNYTGNWWSIVRANAGDFLLKAPVQIMHDELSNIVQIEMKRSEGRKFVGKIELRGENLFCDLEGGGDKTLHIILRTGTVTYPTIVQGVFSGISSSFEPIAGREIFQREKKQKFENMSWHKISMKHARLENKIEKEILEYFNTKEGNCIKIDKVSSFDLDDLVQ